MTFKFGFYNSLNGDRKYDSQDIADVFDSILSDGFIKGFGTQGLVTAQGGLDLNIGIFRAWFQSSWSYNDSDLAYTAEGADAANNRIDAIVLQMNNDPTARLNQIITVRGQASASPVRPTLIDDGSIEQHALAYVTRRAGVASVAQSDIAYVVGTPESPWATSRLLDINYDPAVMHRNTFRGKNLGTSITAAQKLAIANNTLDDLYVGDYWTLGGKKWRIVDFNYFYNVGNGAGSAAGTCTTRHAVVMPDEGFVKVTWNADGSTTRGYVGSTFDKANSAQVATINALFGTANILQVPHHLVNATNTDGRVTGSSWYGSRHQPPTQIQMFGHSAAWDPGGFIDVGRQFALFRIAPEYIVASGPSGIKSCWLRDVATNGQGALVEVPPYTTIAKSPVANNTYYRPVVCIR